MINQKPQPLNATILKLIACLAMLIDHTGAMLFPQLGVMRIIGRIAFPIFAFLLCEGMEHTSSRKTYIRNLLIFAVISEPIFDLALYGSFFDLQTQNTIFTLAVGAITIWLCEENSTWIWGMLGMVAGHLLRVDYGEYGVMLVILFWYYRKLKVGIYSSLLGFAACLSVFSFRDLFQGVFSPAVIFGVFVHWAVFFCAPLLLLYNGKRGGIKLPTIVTKWGFYIFYPLHLALLITFMR